MRQVPTHFVVRPELLNCEIRTKQFSRQYVPIPTRSSLCMSNNCQVKIRHMVGRQVPTYPIIYLISRYYTLVISEIYYAKKLICERYNAYPNNCQAFIQKHDTYFKCIVLCTQTRQVPISKKKCQQRIHSRKSQFSKIYFYNYIQKVALGRYLPLMKDLWSSGSTGSIPDYHA